MPGRLRCARVFMFPECKFTESGKKRKPHPPLRTETAATAEAKARLLFSSADPRPLFYRSKNRGLHSVRLNHPENAPGGTVADKPHTHTLWVFRIKALFLFLQKREKPPGTRPLKRIINITARIFLPFLLGAGILYWMYRGSSWEEISDMLRCRMEWEWMFVSLAFGIFPQILRGWRWRTALEPAGEKPRRATCVWAVFVSYAASLVIPRIGEVTRCGTLKHYENTSFAKSLGTVVSERIVDMSLMLAVTLLTLVTQRRVFATFFHRTGADFGNIFSFTVTEGIIAALCAAAAAAFAVMLVKRLKATGCLRSVFRDLWEGVISLRRMRKFPLYLLYSLAIWLCYYLHFSFTLQCFDFTKGFGASEALVIFCAGSYAVLIPTPNGAGPWHFAVKTMLILYGVAANSAILFALVVHAIQTSLIIALGIAGLTALQFTKRLAGKAAGSAAGGRDMQAAR